MKTIFRSCLRPLAALLFLSAGLSSAQENAPKIGFIRLVHAVGAGTGNLHLKVDGEDMFPRGYKLGQRTGGIGLTAGAKKITLTREGVLEGTTSLPLGVGETMNLIGFAEKMPAEGDKPERWEMRILRLKQRDVENGFRLTVLSVCKDTETNFYTLQEGDKSRTTHQVKRLMTASVDLGAQSRDLMVYVRDSEVPVAVFRPETKGNYVVVLYDDPDGSVKAVSFYDPKFVIAG